MRFKKRLKIVKGLSLNFSNSGTSLTIGGRGASINIGKKGTYLNTGVPILGLYSRKRISGSSKKGNNKLNGGSYDNSVDYRYEVELDEKGKPILKAYNKNLGVIYDEKILNKIKRSEVYKSKVKELQEKRRLEIEKNASEFIEIYRISPILKREKDIRKLLEEIKPNKYIKKIFDKKEPFIEDVRSILEVEARHKIKSIFFWNNKKNREKYVNENLEKTFNELHTEWENKKQKFNKKEIIREQRKNKRYLNDFETKKKNFLSYLEGNKKFIEDEMESILKSLILPFDFSVDYEIDKEILKIDLDLPEIEDFPTEKVTILKSGNISIKEKTQKELRFDYATCITGIAFFFSANFFNISCKIEKILISGYTQRLNKKIGHIEDEYVYSILFDRVGFEKINIEDIDPIQAITNFKNAIDIKSNYELRVIQPIGKNEII